jgi:site-specific recombinase XerD
MKTSLLLQLRPRVYEHFKALPILGSVVEDFIEWLHQRGYSQLTLNNQLKDVLALDRWFECQNVHSLNMLNERMLARAYERFYKRKPNLGGTVRALRLFLCERQLIFKQEPEKKTPLEVELGRFAIYLCEVRGLAERTVVGNIRRLRSFLKMLRYNGNRMVLSGLGHQQIERFLQEAAKTNNRFSLQHVVATLRSYLRFLHAEGIIVRPLHEQIDTPRVYRLENLPRAVAWPQVQALLRSIDQRAAHGLRDFTMLYMAVAYGLRSSELVHMTLEDIDWRNSFLRVPQTKTKQILQLPLTDEGGDVLSRYLRKGRPPSHRRELFLRMRAPSGPLHPTAVHDILENRVRHCGFDFPFIGSHALRHSFALRLLQSGVAMKTIGDVLGHRDAESTAVYLRLGIDDLREVGLPVPSENGDSVLSKIDEGLTFPRVRSANGPFKRPPFGFRSSMGKSMQGYLAIKRVLGRKYSTEIRILLDWDDFLHRHRIRNASADIFQLWTKRLDHLTPTVRRSHMRNVRNFLLFHARNHPGSFVPDKAVFPKPHTTRPPRLVSESEMARILNAAKQLSNRGNPLRSQTFRLAFVLIYCCGLRRGELLRLQLKHFDSTQQLLRIEASKFHKSRLVPLSSSAAAEVRDYLQLRQQSRLPMEEDGFLIWNGRRPANHGSYTGTGLHHAWRRLCGRARVLDRRGNPPHLHDLRHSFAVNALHRWYIQGQDIQAKLPHLATYLGHVSPVSTHYYLHMTPELRQAANDRFHQRFEPLFVEGGAA